MHKTYKTRIAFILIVLSVLSLDIYGSYLKVQSQPPVNHTYAGSFVNHDGIIILNYHRILNESWVVKGIKAVNNNEQIHTYNVPFSEFKKQMKFLKQHHVQVISYQKMLEMTKQPTIKGQYVVLTFDDIDRTMPENAYPILKQYQFPFTFYVITGKVNKDMDGSVMASWSDIKRLAKDPLATVGVHTNNLHYQLNNKPVLSTDISHKRLRTDYQRSQDAMLLHLGRKADIFAYPYGAPNQYLSNYMADHGIVSMVTLDAGIVISGSNPKMPPRVLVNDQSWPNFEKWISDDK
ncbi:polysaccharide deacetylase family protein [Weissella diestrammenae]|uniref:Polysaccharide deacetylase family protein n=1 Tax=Weissella diestrammenae TaxID=1162633 RepID=A0A7G9T5B2_9LACO|nr:polysaccharide deacetylase family protein [Weissella diestrammenae]MCM0583145.1 polysaccharide deacetylase family protein [Weissella diestrammenae]QNN75287.1 polysaccharide deacetylase family protein [Weissella diestrammenae]